MMNGYTGDTAGPPPSGGQQGEGGAGEAGAGSGESGTVMFSFDVFLDEALTIVIGSSGYEYPTREAARDAGIALARELQGGQGAAPKEMWVLVRPNKTGFENSTYLVPKPVESGITVTEGEGGTTYTGNEGNPNQPPENPPILPGYGEGSKPGDYGDYLDTNGKLHWFGWQIRANADGTTGRQDRPRPTAELMASVYSDADPSGYYDETAGGKWTPIKKSSGTAEELPDWVPTLVMAIVGIALAAILAYLLYLYLKTGKVPNPAAVAAAVAPPAAPAA